MYIRDKLIDVQQNHVQTRPQACPPGQIIRPILPRKRYSILDRSYTLSHRVQRWLTSSALSESPGPYAGIVDDNTIGEQVQQPANEVKNVTVDEQLAV